jgi:hypothetical protein
MNSAYQSQLLPTWESYFTGFLAWYGWYMGIIGNIQNNIVVIYEIKSFYVTLTAGKLFPTNIH